jgi:predicted nucleotidyltransferase component of viral defense system
MVKKRSLTADDQQRFRAILQSATISALMDSRRWQPGELAFQGGTCLHLAHGSARFSEDLDFMVRGGLSLYGLSKEVQRRLQHLPGVPSDMAVTVAPSREERNPHAQLRLADLRAARTAAVVSADLKRWLPSSWKMDDAVAATMIAVSVQKLVEGVAVMAARFPRDASPEAAS